MKHYHAKLSACLQAIQPIVQCDGVVQTMQSLHAQANLFADRKFAVDQARCVVESLKKIVDFCHIISQYLNVP